MKKTILSLAVLAFILTTAFTGACDVNDMFTKGTTSKTGYYKADGTLTGTGTSTVTDVTTSGDSTIAVLTTSYTSANPRKGETPHDGSMRFICVDGKIIMDMSSMINSMAQSTGRDMQVVVTGNMVPYKTSYTAGEKLNDVKMNMQMMSNGSVMMTSEISITNRVCEAVEDKTTPAGTFHCYKISETTTTVTKMGAMTMPGSGAPSKSVQWFSTKAGVVRMESYKDDKLSGYNELLELTKP